MRSFVAVLLCCFCTQAAAQTTLANLHQFLDEVHSLRADFSQVVTSQNGGKPQNAHGEMSFSRPGKFRWELTKPYAQLIVGDGKEVWIFDPDLKQVTVKPINQAFGQTPAAFLFDKASFLKNFTLSDLGEKGGVAWVGALPKTSDTGFEKVLLGFSKGNLSAMQLFDNFGQVTSLAFANVAKNPTLPSSLFVFKPPKDVDVIRD